MKMFLRLGVFVFLGIVFLFVGGTADGQEGFPLLGVVDAPDQEDEFYVGDEVKLIFFAGLSNEPPSQVPLLIRASGITITSIIGADTYLNALVPGSYNTSSNGDLEVTGTLKSINVYIEAEWVDKGLISRRTFQINYPFLEVIVEEDYNGFADIADEVTVTFRIEPGSQVPLYISARNINVISIEGESEHRAPILPSNYTTNSVGDLIVRGIFTEPGDASIEARWVQRASATVLFEVRAPLSPRALEIVSGNNQHSNSNTALSDPFVVVVKDQNDNPLPNIPVTFKVTNGDGSLSDTTVLTNSDGQVHATLTLGADPGVYQVVASVVDFPSLTRTFTAAATTAECEILLPASPKATTLLIVSGYGQEGLAGTRLSRPFVVEVRDQYGEPFSGANVVFRVTGGSLSSIMATTNSFGQAQTTLTLGRSAGANWVEASVAGISPSQTFTATAIAPGEQRRATTLSIVSGNNQSGESGMSLGQAFIVGVLDQDKRPLRGIPVTFRVTEGGGQLSSQTRQMTNEYGQAEITLTLGDENINKVTASVSGISDSQTFTAEAAPPAEPLPPSVYWIEGGALYYQPTGGEKTLLLSPKGATLTGGLAVDMARGRIYWTEETGNNSGRIRSANLQGMDVRRLTGEKNGVPHGIAVGTDKSAKRWVYWTTSVGNIQRINVNGLGFERNIIVGLNSPKHIAFDESAHKLYWTEADRIMSADPNGINRNLVQRVSGELGGIAVADGTVYWTEKTGNGQGKIRSVNSNGSASKLLAVLESVPEGIAVDPVSGRLYWTTSDGEIQSALLTGAIQTVVPGEGIPTTGIALGPALSDIVSVPVPAELLNLGLGAPSTIAVPSETRLLLNYPNPFNPETWIPYQLSEPAEVTVSIYSVNGSLIRTLALGHQSAGLYRSRSRAAYWDGRNAFGERVASGLYFYTLTAGDFTATRKMLIRK